MAQRFLINKAVFPQVNIYASDHKVEIARGISKDSKLAVELTDPDSGKVKKIIFAGTIYPSNDDKALGIIANNYDVTYGDVSAAICVHGNILNGKLPIEPTAAAKNSMKLIYFWGMAAEQFKPELTFKKQAFVEGTYDMVTVLMHISETRFLPIALVPENWSMSGAPDAKIVAVKLLTETLVSIKIDLSNVKYDTQYNENNKVYLEPSKNITISKQTLGKFEVIEIYQKGHTGPSSMVCPNPAVVSKASPGQVTVTGNLTNCEFTNRALQTDGWDVSGVVTNDAIKSITATSNTSGEITFDLASVKDLSAGKVYLRPAQGSTTVAEDAISPVKVIEITE